MFCDDMGVSDLWIEKILRAVRNAANLSEDHGNLGNGRYGFNGNIERDNGIFAREALKETVLCAGEVVSLFHVFVYCRAGESQGAAVAYNHWKFTGDR
jgi:hypothetical protein